MKKITVLANAGLLVLVGCMHPYVIKLNNGMEVTASHKPKLEGNTYHYKDGYGKDHYIPAGRVTEVEPASMAKEEQKQFVPPKIQKKRHWYLLWLG